MDKNKIYTVILNGSVKYYTREEVEYLKLMYGDWEKHGEVFVFNRMDFLSVPEMSKLLQLEDVSIYQRHKRDSMRFPLEKRGSAMGISVDKFLSKWI